MPYSHHDFSWTYSRQWHIRRYVQLLSEVVDVLKENKDMTWLIDNVVHSLVPFIEYAPEKIEELKRLAQEGRIAVANGGVSLVRPTYVGEETFIRNMVEGKRFFQSFFEIGNIDFYMNADVGCGHSQLPQILRLGGHKYYRFQRPQEALDWKQVPRQFVWEGLDGSRITVSRGAYGGFVEGRYTNKDFDSEWPEIKAAFCKEELSDKVDALLVSDIAWLYYGCDDCRPMRNLFDEPIRLLEFVEEWNRREQVELRISTPGAYFEALEGRGGLPVHSGVLDPCELSYNAPFRANGSMWRSRSELDRLIVKAESMAVMASFMGAEYPEQDVRAMWSGLFEITGHAIELAFKEDTDALTSIALGAKSAAEALIRQSGEYMAKQLRIEPGEQYVVFNSLGWSRKEKVRLHISSPAGLDGFDLVDGHGNKKDYQIIDICECDRYAGFSYSAVDIVADVDIPTMGYTGLTAVPNGKQLADKVKTDFIDCLASGALAAPDVTVLNNGALEVVLEKGIIREVKDLSAGRTVISGSSVVNGLRFVRTEATESWLSSWPALGEVGVAPLRWELLENGPLRWMYRITGVIGNSRFVQEIKLCKGERAVAFDLELVSEEDDHGYYIVDFPADPDPELHADIPFGVEERDLSQEHYDSIPGNAFNFNSFERGWPGQLYGKSWVSFQSGNGSAAIVSGNCSIYYNHDASRNAVSLLLHRVMPFESKTDRWYLRTHPSVDGKGKHNYSYAFYLPEKEGAFAEIAKHARQMAAPVEAFTKYNRKPQSNVPLSQSFFTIDCAHVLATAFYKEGDAYFLRFFETEGKSAKLIVSLGISVSGAASVDLLGNEIDRIAVNSAKSSVSMAVEPWQIVTLKLYPITKEDAQR